MWPMYRTDGFNDPTPPGRTEKRDDVIVLQARLAALGESIVVDGKLGNATLASVENITGIPAAGDVVTGVHAAAIEAKLFSDGGDGDVVVELTDHAHTAGELRILDLDDKTIEGETGGIVE